MGLRFRRGLVALLFTWAAVVFAQSPAPTSEVVTVTLRNVGSSAWVVTAVEGAENVAELNAENTPITLTTGQRYRFVNLGTLQIHPLALRGKDGESLLNQRPQDRPFETDPAVAFSADDEGVSFTLTETLAAQLATYYCTAHPAPLMEGPLEVASPRGP